MAITAALVKQLRERTGAGMMECKKALVETGGDIETAIELMRKSGQANAAKKAGRTAAEGVVVVKTGADGRRAVMVEVNCETDFVAKDENFGSFADAVASRVLAGGAADVEALMQQPLRDDEVTTIEEARQGLIAKIGENIAVRRFVQVASTGRLASYRHGVRIGVLVDLEGGDDELGRDLAMHIAASNPAYVTEEQVDPKLLASEREIAEAQANQSGKPAEIATKMVEGRLRKWLGEITLLGQPFVKDPDVKIAKLLKTKGANVISFRRYEVGEGIEKRQEDFAEEVKAQIRGQ